MAVGHTFLKFKARQAAILISSGLPHPAQQVQIFKKVCRMWDNFALARRYRAVANKQRKKHPSNT